MFLLVSVRHVGAHPGGHQHGVSIQLSIYLIKHFFGYLFWQSWRGSLYIYLLCLLTLGSTGKFIPPHHGTRGGGGEMEPLPGGFDMLQYFETILPLVESL